jgi:Tol biopolymer transport system component
MIGADGLGARNTGVLAMLKAQRIVLPTPPQKSWMGDEVVFSALKENWASLWSLRLNSDSKAAMKEPKRLTQGETNDREPSVSEDGRIVFGRVTSAIHIWEIPLHGADIGGKQVTDDPATDGCPSVSRDGRWIFFARRSLGVRQIVARDLRGNKEARVVETEGDQFWPIASPDGGRVAFEVRRNVDSAIWIANRDGSGTRKLCDGCSHPTSWFEDRQVFYTTPRGNIALLDVEGHGSSEVLTRKPNQVLGGADWNAANQYLLFTAVEPGTGKQVYAVRFPKARRMEANLWIPLTHEAADVAQPHWATNGNTFYYLASRDNFRCVWGQSFSAKGKVGGAPFPVMHYHDLRFSPDRASPIVRGLTASGTSIYLSVGEVTDTLWLGRLKRATMGARLRSLFGS